MPDFSIKRIYQSEPINLFLEIISLQIIPRDALGNNLVDHLTDQLS